MCMGSGSNLRRKKIQCASGVPCMNNLVLSEFGDVAIFSGCYVLFFERMTEIGEFFRQNSPAMTSLHFHPASTAAGPVSRIWSAQQSLRSSRLRLRFFMFGSLSLPLHCPGDATKLLLASTAPVRARAEEARRNCYQAHVEGVVLCMHVLGCGPCPSWLRRVFRQPSHGPQCDALSVANRLHRDSLIG